ncbi:MAG: NAD-binding protein, partial [bacterium]|nr:NAD-binding protein [bacterium]
MVIIGGGKLAVDAARKCKESGSSKITLLFRESLGECDVPAELVNTLKQEGIEIYFNTAISRLFGEENQLTELEYVELNSQVRENLPVNTLLISSGRFPEFIFSKKQPQKSEDKNQDEDSSDETDAGDLRWEAVETAKKPANKDELGLLAQGDDLTDYTAAIK